MLTWALCWLMYKIKGADAGGLMFFAMVFDTIMVCSLAEAIGDKL